MCPQPSTSAPSSASPAPPYNRTLALPEGVLLYATTRSSNGQVRGSGYEKAGARPARPKRGGGPASCRDPIHSPPPHESGAAGHGLMRPIMRRARPARVTRARAAILRVSGQQSPCAERRRQVGPRLNAGGRTPTRSCVRADLTTVPLGTEGQSTRAPIQSCVQVVARLSRGPPLSRSCRRAGAGGMDKKNGGGCGYMSGVEMSNV